MANTLTIEVDFDSEVPEIAGVGWVAETFGLTTTAVSHAIRDGRLDAKKISGAWLVRPEDAARLWGNRLFLRKNKANN